MSVNKGFLVEIENETANTRKVVSSFKDSHLDWRPHEKSMTVSELVGHVIELHNWVSNALSQDVFDLGKDYSPFKPKSIDEALEALNASYEKNVSFVEAMTDEDWLLDWTLKYGEHVIAATPKMGAMRFIVYNHLIHHRGQLSVYLRLLDLPVPGVYGPSADDNMV